VRCKINLIPYNPVPTCPTGPAPEDRILAFQKSLTAAISPRIRKSRAAILTPPARQLAGGGGGSRGLARGINVKGGA
jgi:adenine C2-methylase RlmN of 23S rRNA A2503 and tRNA A37